LEEIKTFEWWFKDLKLVEPSLSKVDPKPLEFNSRQLLTWTLVAMMAALLFPGLAFIILPSPLAEFFLYFVRLPFIGLTLALCLVIPLWGGHFRQAGLLGLIHGFSYFCATVLQNKNHISLHQAVVAA